MGQQRFQQVLVDLAKAAHTHTSPELVEHPYIRDGLAIGQMGKASPILLLGQHLDQQVEGMDGTQQSQLVQTPQLRGTELASSPTPWAAREQLVDKIVRHVRRKFPEQGRRAGGRKQ